MCKFSEAASGRIGHLSLLHLSCSFHSKHGGLREQQSSDINSIVCTSAIGWGMKASLSYFPLSADRRPVLPPFHRRQRFSHWHSPYVEKSFVPSETVGEGAFWSADALRKGINKEQTLPSTSSLMKNWSHNALLSHQLQPPLF